MFSLSLLIDYIILSILSRPFCAQFEHFDRKQEVLMLYKESVCPVESLYKHKECVRAIQRTQSLCGAYKEPPMPRCSGMENHN